jgi:hypothetical protein
MSARNAGTRTCVMIRPRPETWRAQLSPSDDARCSSARSRPLIERGWTSGRSPFPGIELPADACGPKASTHSSRLLPGQRATATNLPKTDYVRVPLRLARRAQPMGDAVAAGQAVTTRPARGAAGAEPSDLRLSAAYVAPTLSEVGSTMGRPAGRIGLDVPITRKYVIAGGGASPR